MSLKGRIADDISRIYMRLDHFAETHYWNGQEIVCVPDEELAAKKASNDSREISWASNSRNVLIHTPLATFPGGVEPEINSTVIFDKKQMRVISVEHNMGVLGITLSAYDPREMM